MDWITDRIAIGNIEDAMNTAALRAAGVTGVLCLNGFPHTPRMHGFAWKNVTLIDGPGNSLDDLHAAVSGLEELCRSHKVMVHCAEGLSRSAFVVACYLSKEQAITLEAAVAHVQLGRRRAYIDRGLLALVRDGWPPPGPNGTAPGEGR